MKQEVEAIDKNLSLDSAIEFIDIGGPSMLRAAAKNFNFVIPIADTKDYSKFINLYKQFDGEIPLPKDGRVSFRAQNQMKEEYWTAIGYIKLDNFAIRVDVFERIFFIARQKIKKGPFIDSSDLMNPVGCDRNQLKEILRFCGFSVLKLNFDRDLYYIEI